MRRSLASWALGLGLLGCGGGDVARYTVAVDRVVPAGPIDEARLRGALSAALTASDEFAVGDAGEALRLRASIVPDADAATRLHVELAVPKDLQAQFDVAAIQASAPVAAWSAGGSDATPPVDAAAAAAVRTLALRLRLARGDRDAAIGLLGAEDPGTVLLALEWVRDHPGAALADAVAAAMDHEDPQVVVLALEVLALVGEARHASAVIRRVERWPGLAREAYRTLGALGGADAVGFLQFAAANEDEAALQTEAARALTAALSGTSERVAVRPLGVDLPATARGHRQ